MKRQHLKAENICNRNDMKMFSASDVYLYNLYQIYLDGNHLAVNTNFQSFQAVQPKQYYPPALFFPFFGSGVQIPLWELK